MRLLLVEDDADLAVQLTQALGQAGFAVDAVAHGTDADSNVLDVMIGRIRRKLGSHRLLHTRRGQGFVLQPPD